MTTLFLAVAPVQAGPRQTVAALAVGAPSLTQMQSVAEPPRLARPIQGAVEEPSAPQDGVDAPFVGEGDLANSASSLLGLEGPVKRLRDDLRFPNGNARPLGDPNIDCPVVAGPSVMLNAVDEVSADNAWAVGCSSSDGSTIKTLIQRWDGRTWTPVDSPNPEDPVASLVAVASHLTRDAWAVGYSISSDGTMDSTLAEHWDGNRWTLVSTPNPAGEGARLEGVKFLSRRNVWAVGHSAGSDGITSTIIEHWNGRRWKIVPSPNPDGFIQAGLNAVDATSAKDLWAVGYWEDSQQNHLTLVEHWNGSRWKIVPSPTPPGIFGLTLTGVAAVSSDDAWAVGATGFSNSQAIIEHWNGKRWRSVRAPGSAKYTHALMSLSALSSTDVWAVGLRTARSCPVVCTLIEHWNGRKWQIVKSQDPDGGYPYLASVSASSTDDAWTVGMYAPNAGQQPPVPLLEHWDGQKWRIPQ